MNELMTKSEQHALEATKLPAFEMVALTGLKTQVAEMLSLIGRTNEVFATYTKHDISHINAMLKHLDWLIPPSTQEEMTPVDWLLITLAIYFHDLGMLVTSEEFEMRMQNEAFTAFFDKLKTDSKSQDYLGRAKKMTAEQQARFFFQEFIRENHANRIKEWVTGRHSRHWGTEVKPITEAIAELMKPFPMRFRENLATVCESHHRDNLNKPELYPLCQRYGNEPLETANVQYAALILRTVDLIHVTKDRTPSIMYKTLKLSDPKGVDEWDRQKDTFAVRHAGRKFSLEDPDTHIITVSADFTEERPFFALTEYLAWADAEIKQTKRWGDQSRGESDGAKFWFPWRGIRGDLRVEGNEPQQMRFEFDRGRLLDLLVGHAIYNDATVAIRELLQNAIDAVRFRHHLDAKEVEATGRPTPQMGKVSVTWHGDTRRLVVEDSGTGMDLDIIKFHLMRVGASFYDTPQFATEHKGFSPISRFGIGVLTCFMISDDIEIVTIKQTCGYRIRMSSVHADYLLRELPLGDPKLGGIEPHGTRVTLVIREGVDLTQRTVEDILRYWIVMPECRVEYSEVGQTPVKIGFDSPSDALSNYYAESRKAQPESWEGIEIKRKQRVIGNGRYEMALALESGRYTENTFALPPRPDLPAVCIEGIRVANTLPGFDEQSRNGPLATLVSVRGERRLRTTVSRSGLEMDDEYLNLGGICAEMLVDHIKEEIERISAARGKPLSRASSAGKWLSSDLMGVVNSRSVGERLWQLRKQLPLIVMEAIHTGIEPLLVQRTLISPETLERQNHFWTIESRMVDSLGIISRDLGRELSLNEFLSSLAPEHTQLGHSPVLPDAYLFEDDIRSSHHPALVEFSRSYQQTAIKWVAGQVGKRDAFTVALEDKEFEAVIQEEFRKMEESEVVYDPKDLYPNISVAEIHGDESDVEIVQTRMGMVLAFGSRVAELWELIEKGIARASERKEGHRCFDCLSLSAYYAHQLFVRMQTSHREGGMRHGIAASSRRGQVRRPNKDQHWIQLVSEVNRLLAEYGIDGEIPSTLDFLLSVKSFNASDFWRDWHRTKSK